MKIIKKLLLLFISIHNFAFGAAETINVSEQNVSQIKTKIVIDEIVARVNGTNILLSDLSKPRLGTKRFTLEEAINQELFFQEGLKRKLAPSSTDIEKYIAGVRSEYEKNYGKLSEENFEKILNESKLTIKTYKQELYRALTVSNVIGALTREKVYVSSSEVETYYKQHPQYTEPLYLLQTCIVPFSKARTEDDLKNVTTFDWVESGWMNKSQINENLRFITQLNKGEIAKPIKTQYGFQLVKLLDFKEAVMKPLSERYAEIEREIKEKKLSVFEDQYAKELKKAAIIEYLN